VLIAAIETLCGSKPRVECQIQPDPTIPNVQDGAMKTDEEIARMNSLTTREREIISHVARGSKNKDIASRLRISETTVRHHLTNIFSKLEVSSRQKLLILAHQFGLVELTVSSDAPYQEY
jgi:DNA-binding NarL/FixJ family response regulator